MLCRITVKDRVSSCEIAHKVGVEATVEWLRKQRLRWFGHVIRRGEGAEIGRMMEMELLGVRKKGRPARRWMGVVKEDMKMKGVTRALAWDRGRWRKLVHGPVYPC